MPVSEVYIYTHTHTQTHTADNSVSACASCLRLSLFFLELLYDFAEYELLMRLHWCPTASQHVWCVCARHSTLSNAANPCLGEIRSLIRQPQGLHSVITLNPPPPIRHHKPSFPPMGPQVGGCPPEGVCVFGVNAGKGSCLQVAEKSAGMLRHIQTSKKTQTQATKYLWSHLCVCVCLPCVFINTFYVFISTFKISWSGHWSSTSESWKSLSEWWGWSSGLDSFALASREHPSLLARSVTPATQWPALHMVCALAVLSKHLSPCF